MTASDRVSTISADDAAREARIVALHAEYCAAFGRYRTQQVCAANLRREAELIAHRMRAEIAARSPAMIAAIERRMGLG